MLIDDKVSVRIKMYRQGLGDCFLLTFTKKSRDNFNVVIDCGLLQNTSNGKQIMQNVAKDIEETLSVEKAHDGKKKKWLDVVVLTHEHADHISGFSQAKDIFENIHFGEVWAGWVDDESHPKYKELRERFHTQVTGLKAAMNKMISPEMQGLKETVNTLVNDFFEEGMLRTQGNLTKHSPSWDYVINKSINKPRYFSPGNVFLLGKFDEIRIYILGPPEDYQTFTKVDPPSDETYRTKGSSFALAESFLAAAKDDELFDAEAYQPFEKHLRVKLDDAKTDDFFKTRYGFENDDEAWRRIDEDWLTTAGDLALNIDTYTNNTCMAFAIEFVSSKKVLLFPGDAQYANWISWQKLSWEILDGKGGKETVKTEDLLKRTVFYKVGHHGSHNATLKRHGLELMSSPDLVAMIPVDRAKARSKTSKTNPNGWEMPEKNLFEKLKEVTRGRVILADEKDDAELRVRCQDSKFIDKVKYLGSFVRDVTVSPDPEPLFIEFTIEE